MGALSALRHEARLLGVALQYFTRLPVPGSCRFDPDWLNQSVRYFPVAGWVVGAVSAGVLWLAAQALPMPVAALLAVAAAIAVTGAFHEDGLADTFDALGGHVSAERALEIMRDSRIGTFGALALVVVIGLRWQALAALPLALGMAMLLAANATARAGAASLMAVLPYVRLDADAKAKPVAQHLGGRRWLATVLLGLLPVAALALWLPGWAPALGAGVLAAAVACVACARWARRRLGGYTGDVLGCTEQCAEVAFALAVLAVWTLTA